MSQRRDVVYFNLAGNSICTANSQTYFCDTVITKTLQAVSTELDEHENDQVQSAGHS